ncbi:MAG: ComEC/Rec2 family competence protein [Chitinophagaceae bacterium]
MLRILPALMLGIVLQWYLDIPPGYLLLTGTFFVMVAFVFSVFSTTRTAVAFGICLQLLFMSLGSLVVWQNDTRSHSSSITKKYSDSAILVATLQEPLVEKAKSYKAEATVQIFATNNLQPVKGNIIVYLQKDSNGITPGLGYGNQLVFKKPLQLIQNAGNPGGFDYQRYCAFHNVYYQVFLKDGDYEMTAARQVTPFRQMLFDLQKWVLSAFKKFVPGSKESGVAEALLIGYRNDLDADLVQSYSNTGVVHIIAISGMHLGLIYGLLVLLFRPLGKSKKVLLIRAGCILSLLWVFSILTGAAPSIIRSAIMFTFLVLGETQKRKASIYNNLATSALLILLFDPFALWDVGFQLSYAAVLSIAIFATPISKLWHHNNKWIRNFWQLNAVTLAAQILTYPIVAFHFHQFPNLFLFTNIVAVPLSSLILYGLLFLLAVSWIPSVATWVGMLVKWSIWAMNSFIELVSKIPFSLTDGIYFTITQAVILMLSITAASWWLLRRSPKAFVITMICLACFFNLRIVQFLQDEGQRKIIVYNVPQHAAIDVIKGESYQFVGDSMLEREGFLKNFHLKPSRVFHQVEMAGHLPGVDVASNVILAGAKKVILLHGAVEPADSGIVHTDMLIITGSPKLKLADLILAIDPAIIVADGTNSRYKISQWQKEAETLHLRFHAVAGQGAYTLSW